MLAPRRDAVGGRGLRASSSCLAWEMEVLVGFLGGDLDRPVVVGALHNGLHAPTHPLPRSLAGGIRTQSTPGGGGYLARSPSRIGPAASGW